MVNLLGVPLDEKLNHNLSTLQAVGEGPCISLDVQEALWKYAGA